MSIGLGEVKVSRFNRRCFIGGWDVRVIMRDDEAALLRLWREKCGEVEQRTSPATSSSSSGSSPNPSTETWFKRITGRAPEMFGRPVNRRARAALVLPRMDASAPLHLGTMKTRRVLFSPWKPRLSTPKAFPAPVFVDEYDPGALQSGSDCFDSFHGNLPPFFLEVDDRREPELGRVRKLRLRDFQEPASSSTLRRRHFINNFC